MLIQAAMPVGAQTVYAPSLSLNFINGSSLDSRVTFTRGTIGNYFGSNGLLQTATINTPRFDYGTSGSTTLKGLLIEQASTNIALWCRDMTNAAWVKVNTTAALDQVGIDGAANAASSLTATLANATTLQTIVHVSSTDTYSVSIKRITGTGEIDISTDGLTWTSVTINTSNYTRFQVTQSAVTNPAIGIRIVTNGDKIAVDYNQSEVLGFATSPIFTTSTSVARNADVVMMATSAFGFNPNAGTLFTQFIIPTITQNSFPTISEIDDGGANNRFVQFWNTGSTASWAPVTSGSHPGDLVLGIPLANIAQKIVGNYNAAGYSGVLNGTPLASGGAFTIPSGLTTLRWGIVGGANPLSQANMWLQQAKYWPSRLSNSQLIGLTT